MDFSDTDTEVRTPLTIHQLRHTFGSERAGQMLDPTCVEKQLNEALAVSSLVHHEVVEWRPKRSSR